MADSEINKTIVLQIDNLNITVNGSTKNIGKSGNTAPVIINNRTYLPIRTIV